LSDKDFDGSEPPLFVPRGDRELLSLGDVLGKGLDARRGGFALIHENEEPSHGTQDDQEECESDQEDNLSEIQSSSKNKPQPFRTAALYSVQRKDTFSVIPAKAGIQPFHSIAESLDPVFQRGDNG
jgi:hypothetical protein